MMTDLLLDINLQTVPDNYLVGDWQVASRVLNRNDPGSPLAQATRLVLTSDAALLTHADRAASENGQWAVLRDELLNRPYLRFALPAEETRALVTRLRRSADGQRAQLNLYFASGMELQLNLQ
jgi:hypothetical protein